MYKTAIITLSDSAVSGGRADESGPAIAAALPVDSYTVHSTHVLPDDAEKLKALLEHLCDAEKVDLILTTGGTGFAKRDVTPEATLAVAERNAPGIAEAIRAMSMQYTKRAMLSRGVSVIRGETLIINLPGSPKAVRECMSFIMDSVGHGLDILKENARECGR